MGKAPGCWSVRRQGLVFPGLWRGRGEEPEEITDGDPWGVGGQKTEEQGKSDAH